MDQREQREAMLKAREQAVQEYRRLKARERDQSPHIPQGKKQGMGILSKLLIVFLMLIAAAACAAYWAYDQVTKVNSYQVAAMAEPYVLKEGATLNSVVRELAGKDFNPYILNAWVKINRFSYPVIQRGEYAVDGVKTLPQLLADMRDGNVIKVQLPTLSMIEGMNLSMIKRRLQAREDVAQDPELDLILNKPSEFIKVILVRSASDETLLQAIGGTHDSLEGLLMPATYEYEPGKTTSVQLVAKSLVKMAEYMRDRYIERNMEIDSIAPTPYHVLILASLVERESSIESELPLIAGVFVNRLKKGIRLQTDPAVMYGVSPDFRGPLRLSQLRKDTPYNTYTRAGLPPTPIAMPSAASIEAVLNPANTNALYFVARGPDPKEGHIFSATLQEHNRAVAQYRKAVKNYKEKAAQAEADAQAAAELGNGATQE
ncbi:endolytic transglycosylase MltG [Anaerobiospirillum succiniciproducens]|uniref:endolytic transglycosylase MltG n=1 Tax=Anaerobiospirillum succiniciproducens TaxID=13335 RepID=UPI00235394E4|nr:endolytic transglycosylase MltG [Anaerobiospirillum succiniciproducens]MCI6863974.1 endolytic transglycosylase MltG [Anaerobiospirillum succiniciproducens]